MTLLDEFTHTPRIAYFSMEIALKNEIPTYSGGLGILAGDTMRSAADLEIPMIAISLVSRFGYFKQEINSKGEQTEQPAAWDPSLVATPLEAKVAVQLDGRTVWISGWLYILSGHMNGQQPVILLDTDLNENHVDDRSITHYLYGGDNEYRLKQEIVLGIGGIRILQALGIHIRQYHMNEGHSAMLALELMRRFMYQKEDVRPGESPYDIPRVREYCSFTTHTPVQSGHDLFSYDLVARVLGNYIEPATLKHLAGNDHLNMTQLALNLSEYVNGVAKRHAEVSRIMYPGYRVHSITNGVHPFTWTNKNFIQLYDTFLPGWCHEPELLVRSECCIPDESIWLAHSQAKQELTNLIESMCKQKLNPELPILGFARRMTAYKRPDLLFSDLSHLVEIARRWPFQIVMSGKAHPKDSGGKAIITALFSHIKELEKHIKVVYVPNYNMDIALKMVSGVDLWLNTPLRPHEASGTSGMKASFNGVPNLSILDGWWIEGCIEGITGWAIGDISESSNSHDSISLYDKLENTVLPLYYQDRPGWISVMQGAISKNASFFNSHRMMRRYVSETYIN